MSRPASAFGYAHRGNENVNQFRHDGPLMIVTGRHDWKRPDKENKVQSQFGPCQECWYVDLLQVNHADSIAQTGPEFLFYHGEDGGRVQSFRNKWLMSLEPVHAIDYARLLVEQLRNLDARRIYIDNFTKRLPVWVARRMSDFEGLSQRQVKATLFYKRADQKYREWRETIITEIRRLFPDALIVANSAGFTHKALNGIRIEPRHRDEDSGEPGRKRWKIGMIGSYVAQANRCRWNGRECTNILTLEHADETYHAGWWRNPTLGCIPGYWPEG